MDEPTETRLGVPQGVPGPAQSSPPELTTGAPDTDNGGLRQGDSGLGRVVGLPATSDELSEADHRALREQVAEDSAADFAAALRAAVVPLPGFLFSSTFVLAVIGLGCLLLLFILAQAATLLESLAAFPPWAQWIGLTAVVLLLLLVLVAAGRLAWAYIRLRHTGQVDVRTLAALAERQGLRHLATSRLSDAVDRLRSYLEAYPLDGPEAARVLGRSGLDQEEIRRLRGHRQVLLDEDRFPGHAQWLRAFQGSFQEILDSVARRRLGRAARQVALRTAVTPRSVDTVIVLHSALHMVDDLCRIYRLRLGSMGTALVLGRAFVLAYLSSHVEQVAQGLTQEAATQLFAGLPEGIGELGSQLAGTLAPKAAEGAANGIMLYRLGLATVRLLRPVRVS